MRSPRPSHPSRPSRPLASLFAALWVGTLGALLGGVGCDGGGVSLVVELATDYQPVLEVAEIEVRIVGLRASRVVRVALDARLQEGLRLAEVQGLAPSSARRVEILLRRPSGSTIDERAVLVDNSSSILARVFMSRRCRGVVCGEGESCLGERCVPEECTSGLEPSCPEPECQVAEDCAPLGGCSRALCAGAVCAYEPAEELCGAEESCDLDCGCVSAPGAGVALLAPPEGTSTGSVHAPAGLAEHPLRPRLRWRPEPGAELYQVQMDDSCVVGDRACCAFPSPEVDAMVAATEHRPAAALPVSRTPPVGAVYLWRVRACAGGTCGAWSEARHIEVGRVPADYDGDGYAELAVGTRPEYAFGPAGEYVYLFEDDGAGALAGAGALVPFEGATEEGFSVGLASGDFDGDGFFDLAVTSPNAGLLFLYAGGPGGLDASRHNGLDFGLTAASRLLFAADVDGDGYDDLWIQTDAGVALHRGGVGGLSSVPSLRIEAPLFIGQRGMASGGDVDGDGYLDLAYATGGAVGIYAGGPSPSATPLYEVAMPADPDFGATVALGDLDLDGYGDLIVTSGGDYNRGAATPIGAIYLFAGSDAGPAGTPRMFERVPGTLSQRNGWTALVADLRASGEPILVHAAADGVDGDGGVALHRADGVRLAVIPDPRPGVWDALGEDIAALDLDGDGDLDLVLGASNFGSDGAIDRYRIEGTVLGTPEHIEHPPRPPGGASFGYFGASLAP